MRRVSRVHQLAYDGELDALKRLLGESQEMESADELGFTPLTAVVRSENGSGCTTVPCRSRIRQQRSIICPVDGIVLTVPHVSDRGVCLLSKASR